MWRSHHRLPDHRTWALIAQLPLLREMLRCPWPPSPGFAISSVGRSFIRKLFCIIPTKNQACRRDSLGIPGCSRSFSKMKSLSKMRTYHMQSRGSVCLLSHVRKDPEWAMPGLAMQAPVEGVPGPQWSALGRPRQSREGDSGSHGG